MWVPTIESSQQSIYASIADAIERDISTGRLEPGARLPTHRDLARALKVTIGTITRAYREAQRRGLISGEVGRGSYVREQSQRGTRLTWELETNRRDLVVMSQNFPVRLPAVEQRCIAPVLRDLAMRVPSVISTAWPDLLLRHQRVGSQWLRRYGLDVEPSRILISTGFQPALWAIVSALCEAGDAVLADQLTTPGLLTLSGSLKVRVVGVPGDSHGMLPEALQRAIAEHRPRLVYLTPTIHTPTAIVMPEARRREIADIAVQTGLTLLEDDDNLALVRVQSDGQSAPPTLASMAPGHAFLVADVSRSLGLGIRLSYVLAPETRLIESQAALTATTWMPAPMIAELAARLIDSDAADELMRARVAELRERNALAARWFGDGILQHPAGHHAWLRLPEHWRSETFAAEALRRGVSVNASHTFAASRAISPGAVRICLGAPHERVYLERGMRVLADMLEHGRESESHIV